jgi:threonine dehydrogenase-like Zn-dependent dehydrogenase
MMRALTVEPGIPNSARLDEVPEPPVADGAILAKTLALGVCGTDREIVAGLYGDAPPGDDRLILGHESLGRVVEAPRGSGFRPNDLVVGVVRRPDPVPCPACAAGEWDMCRNGRYTERGIKERHGYGADYFRIEPEFAVKIDPSLGILGVLLEPTSVLAKAWDHIERIGARARGWKPEKLLVTGAGPIGLLAALIGVQRGFELHVLDRRLAGGKGKLIEALGGVTHKGSSATIDGMQFDVVIECTGAPPVICDMLSRAAPSGIVCLAGVTAPGHECQLDIGALNRSWVLDNETVFGSVNANCRHYQAAAAALAQADKDWLAQIITRRVPAERWAEALEPRPDDIKTVIEFNPDLLS